MKKLVKSLNKDEANKMTLSEQQQLKAHLKAVAEILYRNTDPTELKSFESIEKSVRRCRIVKYQYYKEEAISSIGSGTVESTIKRIGLRVKISGAQWNIENVSSILTLRCAYLNGQLSI